MAYNWTAENDYLVKYWAVYTHMCNARLRGIKIDKHLKINDIYFHKKYYEKH